MADPSANDNAKGVANATGDDTKEKNKGKMTATEEKSGNSTNKKKSSAASKVTAQMQQMKDANTKYKNLLKMAKDRIEQQEAELKKLKGEKERESIVVGFVALQNSSELSFWFLFQCKPNMLFAATKKTSRKERRMIQHLEIAMTIWAR